MVAVLVSSVSLTILSFGCRSNFSCEALMDYEEDEDLAIAGLLLALLQQNDAGDVGVDHPNQGDQILQFIAKPAIFQRFFGADV